MGMAENNAQGVRLNKFLSEAGICSRREADRLVAEGKVIINGAPAQMGVKVTRDDEIEVKGKKVAGKESPVILAFYKPRGIVCTSDKQEENNIIDYLGYPKRLTYAGRLDKESEGLIIMTNQGDLINAMMRAKNHHEKEYIVYVNRIVTGEMIKKLSGGVWLPELGVQTRKCRVEKIGPQSFRMVLTQGYNRQIRRMCQAVDCHVKRLIRVRILNIKLGQLKKGEYRNLSEKELRELYRTLNMEES